MKEKKSKNQFLLTTSLSVAMGMFSFAAMAQKSSNIENDASKLQKTIAIINDENNTQFPETQNEDAIYPSNKDYQFRMRMVNENFCFKDDTGKCMNVDDSPKTADVKFAGYRIKSDDVVDEKSGFIVGHKEIESSGNIKNNTDGKFFKYWDATIQSMDSDNNSYDNDGQFSPSFPKLCYSKEKVTYPTKIELNKDKLISQPLVRLAKIGGDTDAKDYKLKYGSSNYKLEMPVVPISNDQSSNGIYSKANEEYAERSLLCDTENGCSLTWDSDRGCFEINPYGLRTSSKLVDSDDIYKGYDFEQGGSRNIKLSSCEDLSTVQKTCPNDYVMSFRRNSSDEPYRISQWVKLDAKESTEPIEVPYRTCYRCVEVNAGPVDASCDYIVNEVFEAKKGDCEATVKALVVDPRMNEEKNYLPGSLNSEFNCKTCLCKIEGLLKQKGCN